jgi:hypothetical protein
LTEKNKTVHELFEEALNKPKSPENISQVVDNAILEMDKLVAVMNAVGVRFSKGGYIN